MAFRQHWKQAQARWTLCHRFCPLAGTADDDNAGLDCGGSLLRTKRSSRFAYTTTRPLARPFDPDNLASILELNASIVPSGVEAQPQPSCSDSCWSQEARWISNDSLDEILACTASLGEARASSASGPYRARSCEALHHDSYAAPKRGGPVSFFDYFAPSAKTRPERMTTHPARPHTRPQSNTRVPSNKADCRRLHSSS
ncbi:hypothetical protein ACQY0O_004017 [Thecaphora frezii]